MKNTAELVGLLTDVDDLMKQATTERSHFYTYGVLKRCRDALASEPLYAAPSAPQAEAGDKALLREVLDALRKQSKSDCCLNSTVMAILKLDAALTGADDDGR